MTQRILLISILLLLTLSAILLFNVLYKTEGNVNQTTHQKPLIYYINFFNSNKSLIKKCETPEKLNFIKFFSYVKSFKEFTISAAKDLGYDIEFININPDRMENELNDYLTLRKPEGIIFGGIFYNSASILEHLEKKRIPSIVLNGPPHGYSGHPREKYKYWIAAINPDEYSAGYELGRLLIRRANKIISNREKDIHILAFMSDYKPLEQRLTGLVAAVSESKDAAIDQVVNLSFPSYEDVKNKFIYMKKYRYPGVNIVWCFSDTTALAVLDGARELGLTPGKDILIGGIDWIKEATDEIRNGTIEVSMGGQLAIGAWAVVLIHDYTHKKDFLNGQTEFKIKMYAAEKSNIDSFCVIKNRDWSTINFKKFSKLLNPELSNYNFDIIAITCE